MPEGYLMVVTKWRTVEMAKDPTPSHSFKVLKPAEALCRDCAPGPLGRIARPVVAAAAPPAPRGTDASRSDAARRAWVTIRANRAAAAAAKGAH